MKVMHRIKHAADGARVDYVDDELAPLIDFDDWRVARWARCAVDGGHNSVPMPGGGQTCADCHIILV